MQPTPIIFLANIQQGLARGASPIELIDALQPKTAFGAEEWIRSLPMFSPYEYLHSQQVVSIARIIAKRAMREFSLKLTEDGRVIDANQKRPDWSTPKPTTKFTLKLAGEEINVEYTKGYFCDGTDSYSFTGKPGQPHCLSETGFWSKPVPGDAVEACGGAEAYAVLVAEAKLKGETGELDAIFEGEWRETRACRPREKKPPAMIGQHTAQVIGAEQHGDKVKPKVQKTMFD